MDHANLVLGGWGAALLVFGGYSVHLLRRGRKLARSVPEDKRRWSDS